MLEVYLYGKLRQFSDNQDPRRNSIVFTQVEDGDTIEKIIKRIGIPMMDVGRNIFLNGEYSRLTRHVEDGDRLGLFPNDMQLLYKQYFVKKGD